MIAGSLIAQRAINQNEVRRRSDRIYLAGRCDADKQPTTGRKKLFGDQHGERRTYGTADNANLANAIEFEGQQFSVVAGPAFMHSAAARSLEITHHVAVRIEHTDLGNGDGPQPSLTTRFPQQGFGPENRRSEMVLLADDWKVGFAHGRLEPFSRRFRPEGRQPSTPDIRPQADGFYSRAS